MDSQQARLKSLRDLITRISPEQLRELLALTYGPELVRWLPSNKVGSGEFHFSVLERLQERGVRIEFLIALVDIVDISLLQSAASAHGLILPTSPAAPSSPAASASQAAEAQVSFPRPPEGVSSSSLGAWGSSFIQQVSDTRHATPAVQLGLILTCPEALEELFFLAPEYTPIPDQDFGGYYYQLSLEAEGGSKIGAMATFVSADGNERAGLVADRFLKTWHPRVLVLAGTGAALKAELRPGDVFVAEQIDAYFISVDGGSDETTAELRFRPRGRVFAPTHDLVQAVLNFRFAHRGPFNEWFQRGQEELKGLRRLHPEPVSPDASTRFMPAIHHGNLASGPVRGAGAAFIRWLKARDGSLKALDTTSAGLLESAQCRIDPARTLILRGIAQMTTGAGAGLEKDEDSPLHRYAIRNALRLLLSMARAGAIPGLEVTERSSGP